MQADLRGAYDCIAAFSEKDCTEDLEKFVAPALIIHGKDDQIVPVDDAAELSTNLVRDAVLKIYPGAPHGLTATHEDQVDADLREFLEAARTRRGD